MSEEKLYAGGPAFPHSVELHEGFLTRKYHGMSMRDWFAGMALQGMLACPEVHGETKELCKLAFDYADAMLKEREK